MFVTVKFGEQEQGIFNPQCKCVSLLATIKDRCCIDDVEVDLSDENGNVKNLRDQPNRYADEILSDREKLVLLKVDRSDAGECLFTPLLNDAAFVTETFLAQLASGSDADEPSNRRSRSSGRRTHKQKMDSNKNGKSGSSNSQTKSKTRLK